MSKILITANTAWNLSHFRGGLIRALVADGHELVALSPEDEGVEGLTEMGVRWRPLVMDNKGTGPVRDLRLRRSFARIFREEAPDIVLGYTIKNNIYGAMAARGLGIAFLPNVSGLGTAFLGAGWLQTIAVTLYRRAFAPLPAVIFQNPDDRDLFVDRQIIAPDQAVLVPGSGIDLNRFRPATDRAQQAGAQSGRGVTFLLIARLLREKGVVEFADAARLLRQNHPDARFQLLGEAGADNRTALGRDTIAGWEAEGIVEYLGVAEDVRPAIRAADCVVLPSYREGAPRSLLEGAAMGKPLIATDVAGCRAIVEDPTTGFLCRLRDAADLAKAMEKMIGLSPSARHEMGRAGRAKMETQFDEKIVIDTYQKTIARLIGSTGKAPKCA